MTTAHIADRPGADKTTPPTPPRTLPPAIAEVAKQLRELPGAMEKAQEEHRVICGEITELEEQLALKEYALTQAIATDKDPATGKPKYPNAELREGELKARLSTNADCIEIREKLKAARDNRDKKRISISRLADDFSAAKHLSDLYASWMRQS